MEFIEQELDTQSLAILKWQEQHPQAWGDQDENGIDSARLRANLQLTPAERLQKLEAGRRSLRWLQNARRRNTIR